jgi:hypothetical protein
MFRRDPNATNRLPDLDMEIKRAHLLCVRRRYNEAKTLLQELKRRSPGNPEVDYLLARVIATEEAEKVRVEGRRGLRYMFGLQTTASRLWWGFVGIVMGLYGVAGEAMRLPIALQNGLTYQITDMVSAGRRGRLVEWTRPVYYDLIYYVLVAAIGITGLVFIITVSRGSAQWEELDTTSSSASNW